jgi:hypothetical protein
MVEIKMKIIFVENKTNKILELERFTWKPYIGESFRDEHENLWKVVDISIDLANGKTFIYLE